MTNARFSVLPAKAVQDKNLTAAELRTLAALGLFADKNGWCWPAQATIAEITGVSRQTVNNHIKKLMKLKYLNVTHQLGKGGGKTVNLYQLRFDFQPTMSSQDDTDVKPGRHGLSNSYLTGVVKSRLDINTPVNEPIEQEEAPAGAQLNSHQKRTVAAMAKGIQGHQSITGEVAKHLHINLNDHNKTHKAVIAFLKERQEDGETVEQFAKWWRADWRGKNGSPPPVNQIMEFWPSAFQPKKTEPEFTPTEVWE